MDYKKTKLNRTQARKQVSFIMKSSPGRVFYTSHARQQMQARSIRDIDVTNVLKSASAVIAREGEWNDKAQGYTYTLQTKFIHLGIAFTPDGLTLVIVTAIDKRK